VLPRCFRHLLADGSSRWLGRTSGTNRLSWGATQERAPPADGRLGRRGARRPTWGMNPYPPKRNDPPRPCRHRFCPCLRRQRDHDEVRTLPANSSIPLANGGFITGCKPEPHRPDDRQSSRMGPHLLNWISNSEFQKCQPRLRGEGLGHVVRALADASVEAGRRWHDRHPSGEDAGGGTGMVHEHKNAHV